MNEFSTYEFVVSQRSDGLLKAKKITAVCCYIAFGLLLFTLLFISKLFQLIALLPIAEWLLIFLTWRYLNVDFEYSMTSGVITFTKIYSNRTRRQILKLTIKDIKEIAPYTDEAITHLEALLLKDDHIHVSSMAAPDIYYAVFENDKDKLEVVYFEATAKALSIFKFYNSSTKIVAVSR